MQLRLGLLAVSLAVVLGACSVPAPGKLPADGVHDPHEAQNRRVHRFNRKLDQTLLKGSGTGYSETVHPDIRAGIDNLADTVSLPQTVVNQFLQGRWDDAGRNSLRFSANVVLGFGGLVDVASDMGMPRDESDFGATLAAWGVPEGAYQELPVLGPSTERDTAGMIVDLFTNPLKYRANVVERRAMTAVTVLEQVNDRGQYAETVDSVLYESADSYVQLKLYYLQNRRFELGQEAPGSEIDPLAVDTTGF